jgi:uncharacterized pyridoxamine 5'-phosphate oxidase family protein
MKEVFDFLDKCGIFYLATVEGNLPHVRPFSAKAIFEGKLYLQTGYPKKVSKQIAANPHIEICAFYEGVVLRIEATLVEDTRLEAKRFMIDNNEELQLRGYTAEGDYTEVLYLKDATATFASHDSEPKVVRF